MRSFVLCCSCVAFFVFMAPIFNPGFVVFGHADFEISESEQAIGTVFGQVSSSLKTRYEICPVATVVSMPGGIIKLLGLDFQIYGPLRKEEIRKVLIDSADELLHKINTNEQIRLGLEVYPFTIANIEINLFIIDRSRREITDPDIGIASLSRGEISYLTLTWDGIPETVSEQTEFYEEAKKTMVN